MKSCEAPLLTGAAVRLSRAALLLLMTLSLPALAETADAWLDDDWEARVEAVNEGDLRFLPKPADTPALQTTNHLSLTAASLDSGWVGLYQCQRNLDAVPAIDIDYQYRELRNLRIVSSERIGQTRVSGQRLQLKDVEQGAEICIRAEVRVLKQTASNVYRLRSGPFYRRFLDGYYPVHLDYRLQYPADLLTVKRVSPAQALPGNWREKAGKMVIDTWFEGRLTIEVLLEKPD